MMLRIFSTNDVTKNGPRIFSAMIKLVGGANGGLVYVCLRFLLLRVKVNREWVSGWGSDDNLVFLS